MIERGRLGFLLSLARLSRSLSGSALCGRLSAALRHLGAEQPQCLRLRRIEIDAGVSKNLRCNSLLLTQQAEQQMLGAHVPVAQIASLAHGELENLLCA